MSEIVTETRVQCREQLWFRVSVFAIGFILFLMFTSNAVIYGMVLSNASSTQCQPISKTGAGWLLGFNIALALLSLIMVIYGLIKLVFRKETRSELYQQALEKGKSYAQQAQEKAKVYLESTN